MAQTVIGFFDNPADAQNAVTKLQERGIDRNRIDVSTGNSNSMSANSSSDSAGSQSGNTEPESGVSRFFKNLFGDDDSDAERYSHVGHSSQAIVTVHAQSSKEAEDAADVLDDSGAINVDERASEYGYTGSANRETTATSGREGLYTGQDTAEKNTTIPKIEEELQVGKRTVERGGVRVRSRIVEKPVEESVRLREEHVHVERTPVNRKVSGEELANFKEGEIELVERAEVPVVNKEARVVEEISINKEVNERSETVRDTVRQTDVEVEQLGGSGTTGSTGNTTSDKTSYGTGSTETNDRKL